MSFNFVWSTWGKHPLDVFLDLGDNEVGGLRRGWGLETKVLRLSRRSALAVHPAHCFESCLHYLSEHVCGRLEQKYQDKFVRMKKCYVDQNSIWTDN